MRALLKSAMIQDELVKVGVPGRRAASGRTRPAAAACSSSSSITQRFCGHSRQAGYIAAQCQAAAYMNRFVIVVDDDVDPMNLDEVMWAVCTRCEPPDDIEIMRKSWGSKVDPLLATRRCRTTAARSSTPAARSSASTTSRACGGITELLARTAAKWAHILGTDAHVTPGAARRRGGLPETMMDGS